MDGKRRMKRAAGWLLAAVGMALGVALVLWAGDEWSEAIVQGLAALGGLWYWAFRSRPRVTLRLRNSSGLYLELANVGHRVAKQVTVRCNPPIPWKTTLVRAPREKFGPVEDFGDMDQDQRYVVLVGSLGPRIVDVLSTTTFVVSHESTWGFRRRKSTIRFGGSGGRSSLGEGTGTPIGEIAEAVKKQEKSLEKIGKAIETVGRRLRPPAEGGDDLDLKACDACGCSSSEHPPQALAEQRGEGKCISPIGFITSWFQRRRGF